jgi:hypothetical protein
MYPGSREQRHLEYYTLGQSIEVALISNSSGMVLEEQLINLHPMNPERQLRQEGDPAGLDL